MKKIFLVFVILITLMIGCKEKPTDVDGTGKATFIVIDTSGTLPIDPATNLRLLKDGQVTLRSLDYNMEYKFSIDGKGMVYGVDLLASKYTISINKQISDGFAIVGSKETNVYGGVQPLDTIYLKGIPASPIIINEIYYAGPENNQFYFFDQFVELYNNSETIQYLDGIIVCRCASYSTEIPLGIVDLGDGFIGMKVTYAFQFQGTPGGKQYPIYPHQYVVIAGDAINHTLVTPKSIDLSKVPPGQQLWEFYNPSGSDVDVQGVPKVLNILPGKTVDFLIALTSDAILISSGKNGIRYNGTDIYIDLTTVLDGVQYLSDPKLSHKFDGRIDGGSAGNGIPRYSGQSVERKADPNNPIKHFDSNNSTFDFGINSKPSPGYEGNPK